MIEDYYAVVQELIIPAIRYKGEKVDVVRKWDMPTGFVWGNVYEILSVDKDRVYLADEEDNLRAMEHHEIKLIHKDVWGSEGWATHAFNDGYAYGSYGARPRESQSCNRHGYGVAYED